MAHEKINADHVLTHLTVPLFEMHGAAILLGRLLEYLDDAPVNCGIHQIPDDDFQALTVAVKMARSHAQELLTLHRDLDRQRVGTEA